MAKSRSSSSSGDTPEKSAAMDGRAGGVKKQCEECGDSCPVACRTCAACGFDFFGDKGEKSPSECSETDAQSYGERRRSERVKREKPDYYDALEYETKRKATPTRGSKRDRSGASTPKSGVSGQKSGRGRPSGRATLTWKKGQDDEEDERDRRRRKRPRHRDNDPEEDLHMMDELPPEKTLQCQVSLAEINHKLGIVMAQPS